MLLEPAFKLAVKVGPNASVIVRVRSAIGDSGPIAISEKDVDRLADMLDNIFELLRSAQRTPHAQ